MYVPMTRARAIASVVAMLPLVALWQLIPRPSTMVGEQQVSGTILDVSLAQMSQPSGGHGATHVAQVQLPDGGKARVWLRNGSFRSGDAIELRVLSYDDGHREVEPAY